MSESTEQPDATRPNGDGSDAASPVAATLTIKDHASTLVASPAVLKILDKALSFYEKGYFHSPLYQQKIWDGKCHCVSVKTGKFLTGLVPEVTAALKQLKVSYDVQDLRSPTPFVRTKIDDEFLRGVIEECPDFTLHDYQVDLVNQVLRHKRGVIVAPTSSGKSAMVNAIFRCVRPGTPALLMASKKGLCDQLYKGLVEFGVQRVGRMYDKYKEPNLITVATPQSAMKLEPLLPKIKLLVVDEVHDGGVSATFQKVYKKLTACPVRVAVSATAFKFGGKDKCQKYKVKGYFGPEFLTTSDAAEGGKLTTAGLQKRGTLSSAICLFVRMPLEDMAYELYPDAIMKGMVDNVAFHSLVHKVSGLLSGRTLALVQRTAHGDTLHAAIPGSQWVQGKDKLATREILIKQLKLAKGDVVGIATTGIFTAGINVFLHNLLNCAGGQAEHNIIQLIGRGLRTAADKRGLVYIDFLFEDNGHLQKHSKKRMKILQDEGHDVRIVEPNTLVATLEKARAARAAAISG